MASTIDGKIAPAARGFVKLGSDFDSQRMREIRAEADCVVMGGSTFRAYPKPLLTKGEKLLQQRKRKGMTEQPATVVVSASLSIPMQTEFMRAREVRRIVFTLPQAPLTKRKKLLAAGVELVIPARGKISAAWIIKELAKRGFKKILLEGGGALNALFFEARLVDRIYLTLCPSILGGKASPTICEGRGLPLARRSQWRLAECRRVAEELYLQYNAI
jgi:riboflavin-specific deaminase-like protein